jgi:prepilin-type processing-associated H-X9-DG protein
MLKCPQTEAVGYGRYKTTAPHVGATNDGYLHVDYAQNIYNGGWDKYWTPSAPAMIDDLDSRSYFLGESNKQWHSWWQLHVTWSYSEGYPGLLGNPWPWRYPQLQGHPGQQAMFLFGDGHVAGYSRADVQAMSTPERNAFNQR